MGQSWWDIFETFSIRKINDRIVYLFLKFYLIVEDSVLHEEFVCLSTSRILTASKVEEVLKWFFFDSFPPKHDL